MKAVEAANIAPVVRCLGSAEFEKLSGGSLLLSPRQNAQGQSPPGLNSQNGYRCNDWVRMFVTKNNHRVPTTRERRSPQRR
jgi:hypothetical protein